MFETQIFQNTNLGMEALQIVQYNTNETNSTQEKVNGSLKLQ